MKFRKCKISLLVFLFFNFNTIGKNIVLTENKAVKDYLLTAQSGDTIFLSDGDYESLGWIDNLNFTSSVVIKALNKYGARMNYGNGININNCKNIKIEGLEIFDLSTNSGLVQIQGKSSYITIENCHIYNAPLDADCIKVNQCGNISIIGCHIHDPGARAAGNGQQETLDLLGVDTGLISNCLFTGGTSRQYVNAKGLSKHIIVENCIFKDHNGDQGDAAIVLGGWTSSNLFENSVDGYECENIVVRNNILLNSATGAFQISNVKNGYIYNNLVYECRGYNNQRGLIYVSPGNGPGSNHGSVHLEIFNNIFLNKTPMPNDIMQLSSTTLDSFSHGNNLYFFGGANLPETGLFNPGNEVNVVTQDPRLPIYKGETYDEILHSLIPQKTGPWVDAGSVNVSGTSFSSVRVDILSNLRNGKIDIGPFEFQDVGTRLVHRQIKSKTNEKVEINYLLNGMVCKSSKNRSISINCSNQKSKRVGLFSK